MENGKGKKFDAAQKHFEKQRLKLSAQLKAAQEAEHCAVVRANHLKSENDRLQAENEQLRMENETLKALHNISEEDLRVVISKAQNQNELFGLLKTLFKYS